MDITTLIPAFGGVAYTILAFVVALSIIVAIHEYGHYIVGRWCGIHAEVFSLGFGPVLYARTDRRGTRWQVAALPLGGYVKFLGDADAASGKDAEAIAALPEDRRRMTMHEAPLWARSATVAAGPIFNFMLSLAIFSSVLLFQGRAADPLTVDTLETLPPSFAQELQPGDRILAIDGQTTPSLDDFEGYLESLTVAPTLDYRIERDGQEVTVQGPYLHPPIIQALSPRSAAIDVEMRVGDVITGVDGQPIYAFAQLPDIVADAEGTPLLMDVWRDGQELQFTLVPRRVDLPLPEGGFETRWLIGISGGMFFEPRTESPGVGAALSYGVERTWFVITSSLSGLWNILTGAISSCNISGPVGIAETSAAMASQGAQSFIWFIAVLSAAVGLLNLFPIPILDGGHLVFHAYEAVTGNPPSDRALRFLMSAGLTLLAGLMIFALTNDFLC